MVTSRVDNGAVPVKAYHRRASHRIILNFPPQLAARVIALAQRERRSITKQIELMVAQWLEEEGKAA